MGIEAALIGGGASILGGILGGKASKDAAKTQAASSDRAADLAYQAGQQARDDQAPWRAAGATALSSLTGGLAPGGQFTKHFTMADYQEDPGYQFRLAEGQKGIDAAAGARGSRYSGATLKALARFNSDQGSQEYGRAADRFNADQTTDFNRYASVAGLGQTANAQTAAAGTAAASTAGQAIQNAGTARASGYVGTANAINGTLGSLANTFQLSQLTGGAGNPYGGSPTAYYTPPGGVSNILY